MTRTDVEIVSPDGDLVARRLVVGVLETNCWVLFHPADRQAILVDPGDEPQRIIDACHDLTPTGVVLTQHVFTGDTLFPGGPGLTGWPLSDFATIIDSIRTRLFTLADTVAVHPGHGRSTTIAGEKPSLRDWAERGW